jgi:hypothetical protein
MSVVEIRLTATELSREMGAMRIWLDQHRFEPSGFSCLDDENAVVVRVQFKRADQAEAFATRFGGRANGPSARDDIEESLYGRLNIGLTRAGFVG